MPNIWFNRIYENTFTSLLQEGKVLILYGPRRVGKTALITRILSNYKNKIYKGTGDDLELRELLSSQNLTQIIGALKNYDILFIDEAQRIPQIGYGLKILTDHAPHLKIIVTGSSSFDLSNKIGEPLTGRNKIRILYPLSAMELALQFGGMDILQRLEEFMLFGTYPEILNLTDKGEKIEYLQTIRDSYLLKDIFELETIRNPIKLSDLLKLLAFQIGQEVSLNELSNNLGIAKQSVERYLGLLEKTFIIKRVGGFSRNLRKEVVKTSRYYFWDNGIRNALINNFNPFSFRNDLGMLWENFLFIERLKKQVYSRIYSNNYFWRTYDRKEIDLVEERDGKLYGYEFKWGKGKAKPPKIWVDTYQNASYEVITKENFLQFIT